jgi:hypothetical protein
MVGIWRFAPNGFMTVSELRLGLSGASSKVAVGGLVADRFKGLV